MEFSVSPITDVWHEANCTLPYVHDYHSSAFLIVMSKLTFSFVSTCLICMHNHLLNIRWKILYFFFLCFKADNTTFSNVAVMPSFVMAEVSIKHSAPMSLANSIPSSDVIQSVHSSRISLCVATKITGLFLTLNCLSSGIQKDLMFLNDSLSTTL